MAIMYVVLLEGIYASKMMKAWGVVWTLPPVF